jgi:hypothetical protein
MHSSSYAKQVQWLFAGVERCTMLRKGNMPKLKTSPITETDLQKFVTEDSDFKFEMTTLSELRTLGFDCSHSATYQDPVTQKIRQFDLRAKLQTSWQMLTLAVECKNLKANNPLLISEVPRIASEAYHEIIKHRTTPMNIYVEIVRVSEPTSNQTVYVSGQMVGKKTDQVGREHSSGELVSDDSTTFDKIGQAINSSRDLVATVVSNTAGPPLRVVVPVLVVPDGLLWQVEYDSKGNLTKPPHPAEQCSLSIDHAWTVPNMYNSPLQYRISHLEILTLGFLKRAVKTWLGPVGFFNGLG